MSEHDTQAAFFQLAGYNEGHYPCLRWMHAVPNGGLRNRNVAMKLKREGVKAGVWDVFLPYPSGGWHGLYIEFKFDTNKLTDNQIEFGDYLKQAGYCRVVAYDAGEAMNSVISYLEGEL